MSTNPALTLRKVVKGEPDIYRDGEKWSAVTFNDGLVAETQDQTVFSRLRAAKASDSPVELTTERRASGQIVILECVIHAPRPESPVSPAAPTSPPAPVSAPVSPGTLARIEPRPTGYISTAAQLVNEMARLGRDYNIITPVMSIAELPPYVKINFASVKIDTTIVNQTTGKGTDTYYSKKIHRANERSLSKNGLLKFAQAIGITWDQIAPIPPFHIQYVWGWFYNGHYTATDGKDAPAFGSKRLDLSEGSSDAKGMSPDQLKQQRHFGNEICESLAMERAIRMALNLPLLLTEEYLSREFLVPRAQIVPDYEDPDFKKLIFERAFGARQMLYAPAQAAPMLSAPMTEDSWSATAASTSAAALPSPAPAASAPGDQSQWPEGARFVADVKKKREGHGDKGPWVLWEVQATTGEVWTTFKDKLSNDAMKAKGLGRPIMVEFEENDPEKYPGQLTLTAVRICDPAEPPLPFTEAPKGGF